MIYSTEQTAKNLRAAREAKGLSQRALSEMVGVPQSHISKIENGGVDLRLSSLIEIARALDLEVTLVPRKNLSAVQSITRPRISAAKEIEGAAKASKELQRLQDNIAKISERYSGMKEIASFQRRVNDLNRLKLPTSAIDDLKKINKSLKFPAIESDTLRKVTESLAHIQDLRNRLAHSQAHLLKSEQIRPAYGLEANDHG